MLTPDEKARIQAEEIYRTEVREELQRNDSPKTAWQSIVKFANSSFGIWLLSSVVVGLLTYGWSKYSEERSSNQSKKQQIVRIDTEIAARLAYMDEVSRLDAGPLAHLLLSPDATASVASGTGPSNGGPQRTSVFADFRERSLASLMWELRSLVPTSEVDEIDAATAQAEVFQNIQAKILARELKALDDESALDNEQVDKEWFRTVVAPEFRQALTDLLEKKRWQRELRLSEQARLLIAAGRTRIDVAISNEVARANEEITKAVNEDEVKKKEYEEKGKTAASLVQVSILEFIEQPKPTLRLAIRINSTNPVVALRGKILLKDQFGEAILKLPPSYDRITATNSAITEDIYPVEFGELGETHRKLFIEHLDLVKVDFRAEGLRFSDGSVIKTGISW